MLFNKDGLVFLGKRNDIASASWQMPQGGIDHNENPKAAALRELKEETGIETVEVIDFMKKWLFYDYPSTLINRNFSRYYKGQRQLWFAMRFVGSDDEINLGNAYAEFSEWKWYKLDCIIPLVVKFKRPVYEELVKKYAYLTTQTSI
jgi:putative (di)nucleoside polyphosphate hydrolase